MENDSRYEGRMPYDTDMAAGRIDEIHDMITRAKRRIADMKKNQSAMSAEDVKVSEEFL